MFESFRVVHTGKRLEPHQKKLIEQNHYSKSARSQKPIHIFELQYNSKTVGVALFGQPMGTNSLKFYGDSVIELRRFVLIKDLPKNTATWFISRCLQWLKFHSDFKKVLSYADPNYGHVGTIYKASNFQYLGESRESNPRVLKVGREIIHIRDYYSKSVKGGYSKRALAYRKLIKTGKAKIVKRLKKHVFLYTLKVG